MIVGIVSVVGIALAFFVANLDTEAPIKTQAKGKEGKTGEELLEEYEKEKNTNPHTETEEFVEEMEESPNLPEEYQNIYNEIESYELPKEGVTKSENNLIVYENGYDIHKQTKAVAGREYDPEVGPSNPTEAQEFALALGYIQDLQDVVKWTGEPVDDVAGDIERKLDKLREVQEYTESYHATQIWAGQTIAYLEDSKELMNTNEPKAETMYKKAVENIKMFNNIVYLAALP